MAEYHLSKPESQIKDKTEILRLLKNGKYAIIGMCRNNEPYVVTLSYGYDEKTHSLYFHSALKGLKTDFIKDNPQVCATVIEDRGYVKNDCKHKYVSAVLFGKMSVLAEIEDKKYAMDVLLNHLEENPDQLKARFIKSESNYDKFALLQLSIDSITAKSGE